MTNIELFQEHAHRLAPDPAMPIDRVEILISVLKPETIAAVEKDLGEVMPPVMKAVDDERKTAIITLSEKLPVDDPLRKAIKGAK
jgi:hypothetical protein